MRSTNSLVRRPNTFPSIKWRSRTRNLRWIRRRFQVSSKSQMSSVAKRRPHCSRKEDGPTAYALVGLLVVLDDMSINAARASAMAMLVGMQNANDPSHQAVMDMQDLAQAEKNCSTSPSSSSTRPCASLLLKRTFFTRCPKE